LHDILTSLTRPGIDPRDNLPPPMFRRGIVKLEDLSPGMELSGTVLNVVDFGVFVDIGLSDSGLVHISRLADRFIRDPHEVVGVGDVLKVWVVDVDKSRRRVSLTAIPPGTERPARPPRGEQRSRGEQRPPREPRPQQQRPPRPPRQPQPQGGAAPAGQTAGQGHGGAGPDTSRPPRPYGGGGGGGGGGRRDQRRGGRPEHQHPKTIDRPPTKPKKVKPLTQAMEEGREPLRSFSDLAQLLDKKKQKPPKPEEPPATT
jgi:protein Tex